MDASKAFKKSRTTIYEAIKTGELSRDHDGLIDLSELIRVYGNPIGVQSSTRTEHAHKDVHVHVQSEIEHVLKDQISLLKNQLDLANQREKSLMQHIEDLTHRIEFKGQLEQPKIEVEEHRIRVKISGFQCRSKLNRNRRKGAFGAVFLDPMINHDCLTDMNKVVEH